MITPIARAFLHEAASLAVEIRRRSDSVEIVGPPDVVEALRPQLAPIAAEILAGIDERDDGHPYAALLTFDTTSRLYGVCVWCRIPWELHGRPDATAWRVIDDIDTADKTSSLLADARALIAAHAERSDETA